MKPYLIPINKYLFNTILLVGEDEKPNTTEKGGRNKTNMQQTFWITSRYNNNKENNPLFTVCWRTRILGLWQ